jgi:HNH endonuclease
MSRVWLVANHTGIVMPVTFFPIRREIMYVLSLLSPQHSDFGIKYISNVVHHRGGMDYPEDIQTIDDPRNGLLLNVILHGRFGNADVAFLKVCYSF